jgi:effector-binding domain-containing protein
VEGEMTFSIMYLCDSDELMKIYTEQHAPLLQKEHSEKFTGYFAAFRTLLTVIEEF